MINSCGLVSTDHPQFIQSFCLIRIICFCDNNVIYHTRIPSHSVSSLSLSFLPLNNHLHMFNFSLSLTCSDDDWATSLRMGNPYSVMKGTEGGRGVTISRMTKVFLYRVSSLVPLFHSYFLWRLIRNIFDSLLFSSLNCVINAQRPFSSFTFYVL